MQLKNYNTYFFFVILIGATVLTWFVLRPFVIPFMMAAILAHLFYSLYKKILGVLKNKTASSLAACFAVALVVIIPIIAISSFAISEIQSTLVQISSQSIRSGGLIASIMDGIQRNFAGINIFSLGESTNKDLLAASVSFISQNVLSIFGSIYTNVAHLLFVTFIMFFSLFYLFINGEEFVGKIMQLSPIRNSYEKILLERFNSITRATIKGTLLIAILQGLMGGILFALAGVPAPALLGVIMVLASVIPAVGAGLVWAPVGLIMLLAGHVTQGIVILAVGMLFISTIDNFIRPALVGRDTQMHPLLILFATLGGISMFGITGFIVGPVIMSLFLALWDIYHIEFKSQLKKFNE